MLLLLSGPSDASVTPPPVTTTPESGHPGHHAWGPWKPIRTRPLVRGSVSIRIGTPSVTVAGTVLENEDWLLGIAPERPPA